MTSRPPLRLLLVTRSWVDVTDPAVLEEAALADIDTAVIHVDPTASDDPASVPGGEDGEAGAVAERKNELRDEVRGSVAAALDWLVDPSAPVTGLPGVEFRHGFHEVSADPMDSKAMPDFAALFAVCACGNDACEQCAGFQVTPRTAMLLWSLAALLADNVYDDVESYGDEAVTSGEDWAVLDRYPRLTWGQDAVWRRQAARAFDDLADDLEHGRWPQPRCIGEEMALHLMLLDAHSAVTDDWAETSRTLASLPEHEDDLDWGMVLEMMFQDTDVLQLFENSLDGIEDPDNELNRSSGMGDMRPPAWFKPFANVEPRDGRRPFRR